MVCKYNDDIIHINICVCYFPVRLALEVRSQLVAAVRVGRFIAAATSIRVSKKYGTGEREMVLLYKFYSTLLRSAALAVNWSESGLCLMLPIYVEGFRPC